MNSYFREEERRNVANYVRALRTMLGDQFRASDFDRVRNIISDGVNNNFCKRDKYGINPVERCLSTAHLVSELIAPDRNITIATLLYNFSRENFVSTEEIRQSFGEDVAKLVQGLINISSLYTKQAAVEDDNFHKLLFTFAEDIRVIIIMIVDRLQLMRRINHHPDEKFVRDISSEARYLYAPLAHRLGLYTIKSELEDLSLKYLNRKIYTQTAEKLNETTEVRDSYVTHFIEPIRERLQDSNIKFEIKGRTKSINSIWNKMKKKDVDLNEMYDLFAIRIILDTPQKQEKQDCWIAYSIVTDIYTANVSRLKDWISIPKSNGYESLHITVKGPQSKWVEVQIRTKRMDEIAERGLAAHWKYKGIKSEGDVDKWMNNVREVLEAGASGQMGLIREMNMNLYEKEVFVFTPKGDLFKLPQGATILDFAFHIHSKVGCTCTGAKVNGKNQKLNYKLKSGDTIEILTASTQTPRQDWLNIVVTSKARNKIKQAVNEEKMKKADFAREMLSRRFKNRKIEADEATISKLVTKLGYKSIIDFYSDIAQGNIDVNVIIEKYIDFTKPVEQPVAHETADKFVLQQKNQPNDKADSDILIIDNNVKGINYKFSKCCNPIYGDKITGFIASDGAIKIHRTDCGNIKNLKEKYPYRIIQSKWSGKIGNQFAATLRVVGQDDIGIVSNITSLINKEGDAILRNISINSNGELFEGILVIGINSSGQLTTLMDKIKKLKGVKDVMRTNN